VVFRLREQGRCGSGSIVVSHKYIKKSRTEYLEIVESLNIKNSKLQIANNKQYPNSKLQKIPLTPLAREEFSSVPAQAECSFSQTAELIWFIVF